MSKASRDAATVASVLDPNKAGAFARAIGEASATAHQKHEEIIREKLLELHRETYGTATAYDNGVILAGYVAFFALWAATANDVSEVCRLSTAALMGASLLLYMGWHIGQMLVRQMYEFKAAAVLRSTQGQPEQFNKDWIAALQEQDLATARLLRFWPFVFVPSVVLGFAGGIVLSYNALAIVLGWPELTG